MSVGRICTREVDFASVEETAWQVAERMHQRGVGTILILGEDRDPVGIITDRDLVMRVIAPSRDPHLTTVAEVMTPRPETIIEDAPIETALERMRRGGYRRLPVVNQEGQMVGLVTMDDILLLFAEEMRQIGSLVEKQTPRTIAVG